MNIQAAIEKYLQSVSQSRSDNTARSYGNGLGALIDALRGAGIDPDQEDIKSLDEGFITEFIASLRDLAQSTEALYVAAVRGFYQFLQAERLADINLARIDQLIKMHSRRNGHRLPKYKGAEIEQVLDYIEGITARSLEDYRDKALLLSLADTGLENP